MQEETSSPQKTPTAEDQPDQVHDSSKHKTEEEKNACEFC